MTTATFHRWESIDRIARQPYEKLRESSLGHQAALDELWEIWEECRNPGWDGYDALPVEQATRIAAYTLINSLPIAFPRPSISAEPDGQLTLEWRKAPHRILSVSVDPDGYLHYAGINGAHKFHGSLPHYRSVPEQLLQLVQEQ